MADLQTILERLGSLTGKKKSAGWAMAIMWPIAG